MWYDCENKNKKTAYKQQATHYDTIAVTKIAEPIFAPVGRVIIRFLISSHCISSYAFLFTLYRCEVDLSTVWSCEWEG